MPQSLHLSNVSFEAPTGNQIKNHTNHIKPCSHFTKKVFCGTVCAPEVGLVSVPGRTVSYGLTRQSVSSRADSTLSWMFICSCLYLCLLHLYSHHPTVPLTVLPFDLVSVISVEALCDCADVGLPVHPDLSQNPLALLQPLGSVQL